jgi:type I restriction enzyme S subunit
MAKIEDAAGKYGLFTDGDWILSENMSAEGTIGVIQLKHVGVGEFHDKEFQFISNGTFTELGCTEVRAGDVLISRMADPIGRACIVPRLPFRAVTAVDVSILRVDESVADKRFITYLCNSQLVRNRIARAARGTTRSRITRTELGETEIPLPRLSEQQQIAGRLEQADRLVRTRSYALELTDTFLPAAFLEFFDDPVQNAKGWPVVIVEEAGTVQLGRQRAPKYQTGKFRKPYIRVANVYENEIDLSDLLYMDFDASDYATYALEHEDILLNEGQSTELVGRPAMWRNEIPDCCFQNTLLRFQADRKVCEPAYALWLFLRYLHTGEFAKLSAKTSSVAHLGSYRLAQMRFPLPPLPLQQKFAALVERVERLRAVQREALRQAEHLFASLLDRAFSASQTSTI